MKERVKERVTHEFRLTVTDLRKEIITFAAKLEVSFHTKNHVRYVKKCFMIKLTYRTCINPLSLVCFSLSGQQQLCCL